MHRIDGDTQVSQRTVESKRNWVRAWTHPQAQRWDDERLESVRLLDLELQRGAIEVERQVVLVSDQIVDCGDVVASGLYQHPGPVQRLARHSGRPAFTPGHAAAGNDCVEQGWLGRSNW